MTKPREALAEMIRHHYRTAGENAATESAESALKTYDCLLKALCMLVGGNGHEGDLFSAEAHELARAAIKEATGN